MSRIATVTLLRTFLCLREAEAQKRPRPVTPDGSGFTQTTLVTGFERPTAFAYADDGRVFVSEKAGRIKVVENGEVVSTFIDISDEVDSTRDRGLIGFALDPDFETNGWVYFHFSEAPVGDNVAADGYGVGGQLIKVMAIFVLGTQINQTSNLNFRIILLGYFLPSFFQTTLKFNVIFFCVPCSIYCFC